MTDGVLPTLVSSAEVRVFLDDVVINARKGQLFVSTLGQSFNNQLRIAKWRYGLDLQGTTCDYYRLVAFTIFFCFKLTFEDEVLAVTEPAGAKAPLREGDSSWQFSGSAG